MLLLWVVLKLLDISQRNVYINKHELHVVFGKIFLG